MAYWKEKQIPTGKDFPIICEYAGDVTFHNEMDCGFCEHKDEMHICEGVCDHGSFFEPHPWISLKDIVEFNMAIEMVPKKVTE